MATTERTSGWTRPAFWIWTAAGVLALFLAWMWFGLSFMEEMTEHCRALSAQTSMEGWGALLGLPPLLLAHAIGLLILAPIALGSWTSRARAVFAAVSAVALASIPGVLLAQWFWSGQLFAMTASAANCELRSVCGRQARMKLSAVTPRCRFAAPKASMSVYLLGMMRVTDASAPHLMMRGDFDIATISLQASPCLRS